IVRFDFRETRRANLGHARGLVERESASEPRILEFFSETFDGHGVVPVRRRRQDRPESRAASRLLRDPKYRAAREYQRCAPPACNRAATGVVTTKSMRASQIGRAH